MTREKKLKLLAGTLLGVMVCAPSALLLRHRTGLAYATVFVTGCGYGAVRGMRKPGSRGPS
jgi:uncharacterized membrane protein (UPF0136 family)